MAERYELYIRPYIVAMKDLLDTAGKRQRRGKLNCVRLAIIDASLFPPNSLAEIASPKPHRSMVTNHIRLENTIYKILLEMESIEYTQTKRTTFLEIKGQHSHNSSLFQAVIDLDLQNKKTN